jgi:hypothetical protein
VPTRVDRLLEKVGIATAGNPESPLAESRFALKMRVRGGLTACVAAAQQGTADISALLLENTAASLPTWQDCVQRWCIGDQPFDPELPMQQVPAVASLADTTLLVSVPIVAPKQVEESSSTCSTAPLPPPPPPPPSPTVASGAQQHLGPLLSGAAPPKCIIVPAEPIPLDDNPIGVGRTFASFAQCGFVIRALPTDTPVDDTPVDEQLSVGLRCASGYVAFRFGADGIQLLVPASMAQHIQEHHPRPPLCAGDEIVLAVTGQSVVADQSVAADRDSNLACQHILILYTKRRANVQCNSWTAELQVVTRELGTAEGVQPHFEVLLPDHCAIQMLPTPICPRTRHTEARCPAFCKYPKAPTAFDGGLDSELDGAPSVSDLQPVGHVGRFAPVPPPRPQQVTSVACLGQDGTDINPSDIAGSSADPRLPWTSDSNLFEVVERALTDLVTRGAITQEYGAKLLASVSDKYDSRTDMAECHELLDSIDAAIAKIDRMSDVRSAQQLLLSVLEPVAAACDARKAALASATADHGKRVLKQAKKYKGKKMTTRMLDEKRKLAAAGQHLRAAPPACAKVHRLLEAVRAALSAASTVDVEMSLAGGESPMADAEHEEEEAEPRTDGNDSEGALDEHVGGATTDVGGATTDVSGAVRTGDEVDTMLAIMIATAQTREAVVTLFSAGRQMATKLHAHMLQATDGGAQTAVGRVFVSGLCTDDARILRTVVCLYVQHLSGGKVGVAVHTSDGEMALASLRKSTGQPADAGDVKRLALAEVGRSVKQVKAELARSRDRRARALEAAITKHAAPDVPMDEVVDDGGGRGRGQASATAPALAKDRTELAQKGALLVEYLGELLCEHTPLRMNRPSGFDAHPIADTDPEFEEPDWSNPTAADSAFAQLHGIPWDIAKALRHLESQTRGRRQGTGRVLPTFLPNLQSPVGVAFTRRVLGRDLVDAAAEVRLFELGEAARSPDVSFAAFVRLIEQVHYEYLLAELRAAGMDLHDVSILPYIESGTTLSPAIHVSCWFHRYKSLVAELRKQMKNIRPMLAPLLSADIMLGVLGELPAGQPRIEALLKSLRDAIDAQNVASAIGVLEAPELQDGLVEAGHPFMAIVLKILAQGFAAIDSKGIPRAERVRRLTTLKTLCMLLLDTDVHDVHVIHDSRYTNVFGMQRDIIFTLMQNVDAVLWVLELHPDMDLFVVDPALTPDSLELYFSVISGLLGFKPTKTAALSAMAKIDFTRQMRGNADTRFVVIASSKSRYTHHKVARARYYKWNGASMMRAWPEVLGAGCETAAAHRVIVRRGIKMMRCAGTRAQFASIRTRVHNRVSAEPVDAE